MRERGFGAKIRNCRRTDPSAGPAIGLYRLCGRALAEIGGVRRTSVFHAVRVAALVVLVAPLCASLVGCSTAPRSALHAASDGALLLQSVSASGVPQQTLLIEPDGTVRRAVAGGALVRFAMLSREQTAELFALASHALDDEHEPPAADASATPPPPTAPPASQAVRVTRRAANTIRQRWLSEASLALWTRALELARAPDAPHGL